MATIPTLNVIYSRDEPKDLMDQSFVGTTGAWLPPAPTPSDANAQDIVFVLPDDSVCMLTFDITDPNLVARVAQEYDSLYVLYSTKEGIERFHRGLFFTSAGYNSLPMSDYLLVSDYLQSHPLLRGEEEYIDASSTPKRDKLLKAFDKRAEELKEIAKTLVEEFQPAAQKQAGREIQRGVDELFHEAGRYLGMGAFASSPEQPSDAPPAMIRKDAALAGKDVAGLAEAFTRIHKATTALEQAQKPLEQALTAYSAKWPPGSPSGGTPSQLEQAAQQLAKQWQQTLEQDIRQMSDALKTAVLEGCRVYPVLYRLWKTPITSIVATIWETMPESSRIDALQRDGTLRVGLIDLINKTYQAAQELQASFRQDAEIVWKYERVVYATLKSLGLTRGDLAYRAVEEWLETPEKTREEKTWVGLLSNMSAAAAYLDLLAGILGIAAPEVSLLVIALSGVEFIMEIVTKIETLSEQKAAFDACLDPGKCLVIETGSFVSALVTGLFLLWELMHVPEEFSSLLKPQSLRHPMKLEELFTKSMKVLLEKAAEDLSVSRTVVEFGPEQSPWFSFVTTRADNNRAWNAYAGYVQAVLSSERRDSSVNRFVLDMTANLLKTYVSGSDIPSDIRDRLLDDLAMQRQAYVVPLETVLRDAAETQARLASCSSGLRVAGDPIKSPAQAAVDNQVALLVRSMRDTLGKLRSAQRTLTDMESLLLQAFAKVDTAITSQGWAPIYKHMAAFTPGQRGLIKQVTTAVEELEKSAVIEQGLHHKKEADELEQAIEEQFARIDRMVRNRLKGLLNEAYTGNWPEWTYERTKLLDEAVALANRLPLPTQWNVALISDATNGPIRLNGAEIWNEVILIVERVTTTDLPRAMLFAAAQLKSERDVSAVAQVILDITARERPGTVLDFVDDKGMQHAFKLYPLPQDVEPRHWVLNAMGGKYSLSNLQQNYRKSITINLVAYDLSVTEINALCNALLMSAAKNYP